LGVVHYDERMQKLLKTLCWNGKALSHNDEKETSIGAFKKPVE
jgi:hypothetical protein